MLEMITCIVCLQQYLVRVRDQGTPQRTSDPIPLTIFIQRNNYPPVFINEVYTRDITDTFQQGANIITVTAMDNDTVVRQMD